MKGKRAIITVLLTTACVTMVQGAALAQSVEEDGSAGPTTITRQNSPDVEDSSEIIVTGTLLKGVAPVGTTVTTFDAKDVLASGAKTTTDLLVQIPQVAGFASVPSANSGTSGTTITRPTLRGVNAAGASTTLVLMNGHNLVGAGITSTSADPQMIPPAILQRVDVVMDGGSSLYGSDAIGGIINFVTRKRYDGIGVDASYGVGDDYSRYQANVTGGSDWGSGSALLSVLYRSNTNLSGADRDYFAQDLTPFGGNDRRGQACEPGNVTVAGVNYALPNFQAGVRNLCDTADFQDISPEEEQTSVYSSVTQELGSTYTFDVTGLWGKRETTIRSAQVTAANRTIKPTNPYFLPVGDEASQLVSFSYSGIFGPSRLNDTTVEWIGITPSVTADWGDWEGTVLFNYGKSITTAHSPAINSAAETAALAGTTLSDALNPYNLSATNPSVLRTIGDFEQYARAVQRLSEARVNLDGRLFAMPGGDVRLAVGGQFSHQASDAVQTDAPVGDLSKASRAAARRDVWAVFAEVYVPLVGPDNSMPGIHSIVLDGSIRYDDYSDFGGTTNPKFGVTYEPFEGFNIRGNYGTAFNAPSLADTTGAVDTRVQVVGTSPWQKGGFSDANLRRPTILLAGGSEGLGPQKAHTWALGADFKPTFAPQLTLSATYWSIQVSNQIAQAPFSSQAMFDNPAYADYWILNPTLEQVLAIAGNQRIQGPPLESLYQNGPENTPYVLFNARRLNLGKVAVNGIDFSGSLDLDTNIGRFNLYAGGMYLLTSKTQATPTDPWFDQIAAGGLSRLQLTSTLGYEIGNFSTQATLRWRAGYDIANIPNQTHVSSFTPVDLFFRYDLGDGGMWKDLALTLHVGNVFNENPSFLNAGNGVTNGETLGRLFTFGIRSDF